MVLDSFERLRGAADIVLVEGAGSASETNLRAGDIANMGFARASNMPVVLLGDIDRGGVIASLVGTQAVLDAEDAACIRGFIVNRMRGDASLFDEGMRTIARHTGWAALGLVPFLDSVRALPAEDAADLHGTAAHPRHGSLLIAVPMLPGIANFDDLDPLRAEPGVTLVMVPPGKPLPTGCAGGDPARLEGDAVRPCRAAGAGLGHRPCARTIARAGRILGLCGGYQMLGRRIADPDGIEGPAAEAEGLGLLDIETVLTPHKRLSMVSATLANGESVQGYEMHLGLTRGRDTRRPMLLMPDGRQDGAISPDGLVSGTYLHGLFAADDARRAWLGRLGLPAAPRRHEAGVEAALDALAAHLESHVDIDRLLEIAQSRP